MQPINLNDFSLIFKVSGTVLILFLLLNVVLFNKPSKFKTITEGKLIFSLEIGSVGAL